MKKFFSVFLLLVFSNLSNAQDGISYLKKIHEKNYKKWYKNLTFIQTTEIYRNDSLIRTETWYEAFNPPYDLRIDIDNPAKGNLMLYKKDSSYFFKEHLLKKRVKGTNPFIFFIGGMFTVPFNYIPKQLETMKIDIGKGYKAKWKEKEVYVIGRSNESEKYNSIWIDIKDLVFVRMIADYDGTQLDAYMSGHVKLPKGTSETKVDIYVAGKLLQVEHYNNLKINVSLDKNFFDPANAASAKHWFTADQ